VHELTLSDVSSVIASGNYGVCYEPIIDLHTMEVFAYEALSRFKCKYNNITPDVFFKTIHKNIDLFFLKHINMCFSLIFKYITQF